MRFHKSLIISADNDGIYYDDDPPPELKNRIVRILKHLLKKYSPSDLPHTILKVDMHLFIFYDDNMPFRCRYCGKELDRDAAFCSMACAKQSYSNYRARCQYCGMPAGTVYQPCQICRHSCVEAELNEEKSSTAC